MNRLPEVTEDPRHHPDCCLSISAGLLDVLTDTFSTALAGAGARARAGAGPGLVLSIGSGSGLLEALLLSRWSPSPSPPGPTSASTSTSNPIGLHIEGVEVRPSSSSSSSAATVNRYLPDPGASFSTVAGSWDVLSPRRRARTSAAVGLLFAYPRSPALVGRYVRTFSSAAGAGTGAGADHPSPSPSPSSPPSPSPPLSPPAPLLRVVVWLGHRSDWPDFEPCLAGVPGFADAAEVVAGADAGLVQYEMMAVLRRRRDGTGMRQFDQLVN